MGSASFRFLQADSDQEEELLLLLAEYLSPDWAKQVEGGVQEKDSEDNIGQIS